MKANIHPNWQDCKVTCACGNTFMTRATTATMQVDICNKCHPFFTGEQRFVDKEGRLEKFQKKMEISKKRRAEEAAKQSAKIAKKRAAAEEAMQERKSFKQILNQAKSESEAAEKLAKRQAQEANPLDK